MGFLANWQGLPTRCYVAETDICNNKRLQLNTCSRSYKSIRVATSQEGQNLLHVDNTINVHLVLHVNIKNIELGKKLHKSFLLLASGRPVHIHSKRLNIHLKRNALSNKKHDNNRKLKNYICQYGSSYVKN